MRRTSLNGAVVAEVDERFRSEEAKSARELLEQAELPLVHDPVEAARIHMAAIKWADGDLDRLRRAVALATVDWRDLLDAAGLADAGWRVTLAQAGFRVPS